MDAYDAYLFEWDGTLTKTLEAWLKLVREQFGARGITPNDKQIAACLGNWQAATQFGLSDTELSVFIKECDEIWYRTTPSAPLYEGVLDVLGHLQARSKKLVLLTTSLRRTAERELEHYGLQNLFDLIVAAGDISVSKPDPESVEFALRELNVQPMRALLLGSSRKDLEMAHAAGVDSLLFYPPTHAIFYDRAALTSFAPCYVIASWSELLQQDAERKVA